MTGDALVRGDRPLLLRGGRLPDRPGLVDIRITGGSIEAIGPALDADGADPNSTDTVELDGRLVLPGLAEPHAHLDKAFLAEIIPNPQGDLLGAIDAMSNHRHLITLADTIERAERAARLMVANGVTAIRTHADTTTSNGMTSVHALIEVRERLRGIVDIQVCTLVGRPVLGLDGAETRALMREAIAAGIDVVGGCPHLESDPAAAVELFLDAAGEAGLPIDLHTDETLNPDMLSLEHLARRILATGYAHGATASHCVSLGVQSEVRQRAVAELVAEAGISVVALPHTNLFLQGRAHQASMPRALTAVKALTDAGANVCAGADNLQDPFNPVGRADPLETAGLMIMVAHLLPQDALDSVSVRSRRALGLPDNRIAVGARADLVAVPASTVREAIAFGPGSRIVVTAGRVVAGIAAVPA